MNIKIPYNLKYMAEYKQVKMFFTQINLLWAISCSLKKISPNNGGLNTLAVSNGTVALDIALKSIDIKFGDEIVPAIVIFQLLHL